MNWTVFLTNAVSAFLLPPLSLITLIVIGYLLRKKWPRFGFTLGAASLLILVVLSTKAGASLVIRPLEDLTAPLTSVRHTGARAIVVLGGGRQINALEYGGQDVPSTITLVRLRYAAKLHRETGLPVLVTGGAPDGAPQSEAAQMARVLREDFSIPVQWLEEKSHNTAQNAQFSARMLQPAGIRRIVLVTDAMHMPRSQRIFTQYGFDVVSAPTRFVSSDGLGLADFIPRAHALYHASFALHEWIGMCWYRLRY